MTEPALKRGGKTDSGTVLTPSPNQKPATSFAPRMLTKSEIESLRQDMRRRHEANKKALETMDLSHLMD